MAKTFALIFGVVFVLVAIMGFIGTPLVGMEGYFMTDTLHDLVHLIIGAVLLFVAVKAPGSSAKWLKIFGALYLLLAVLGFLLVPAGGELLNLVAMNHADHWLHVVLGVVLLAVGFLAGKQDVPSGTPSGMM